jgi:hypothetical protein
MLLWMSVMIGAYIIVRLFEVAIRTPGLKWACYIVVLLVAFCVGQVFLIAEEVGHRLTTDMPSGF